MHSFRCLTRTTAFLILLCMSLGIYADDWMKRLPDNAYVSQLSIPGTHDSATGHGFQGTLGMLGGDSYGRAQDLSITDQWNSGIRAFDLRPAASGQIFHGVIETKLSLSTAMQTLCSLLDQHPSEFAIILIQHENADNDDAQWNAMVSNLLGQDWTKSHAASFSSLATVGSLRGKFLLLSRNRYANTAVGAFVSGWNFSPNFSEQQGGSLSGQGSSAPLSIQDFYDCSAHGAKEVKTQAIKNLMHFSTSVNNDSKQWFINHASGYSKTTSLFGNVISTSDGYRDNAATQSLAIRNYLAERPGPTGIVMMDFAGTDRSNGYDVGGQALTNALIENNFRYEPKGTSSTTMSSPYNGSTRFAGTYYLYNVESGLFLQNNQRNQNYWTTRAELDKQGLDIAITALKDGGYQLNPNLAGNNSINANGDLFYMDTQQPVTTWQIASKSVDGVKNTVTITSENTTLAASADGWLLPGGQRNTWQLVSKSDRLRVLRKATPETPYDATWLIPFFEFGNMNQRYLLWENVTDGGTQTNGGNPDWARANRGHENWNSKSFSYSHVLTGLPNGHYQFSLQGFYRDGSCDNRERESIVGKKYRSNTEELRAYYFAGEERKPLVSICLPEKTSFEEHAFERPSDGIYLPDNLDCAVNCFALGYYQNPPIDVTVTDGTLRIGIAKDEGADDDWVAFDNLRLTYFGAYTDGVEDMKTGGMATAKDSADSTFYHDLTGRRIPTCDIGKARKGIYIFNGRKVFIR